MSVTCNGAVSIASVIQKKQLDWSTVNRKYNHPKDYDLTSKIRKGEMAEKGLVSVKPQMRHQKDRLN